MGTNITFNGVVYTIPAVDDVNWGDAVTDFLTAIPAGTLDKVGGSWALTGADLDFGSPFGLVATYYKSKSSTLAQTGAIRFAKGDLIAWRNNGNTDNNKLGTTSDLLVYNTVEIPTISSTSTLTNKTIDADSNTLSNIRNVNVATDAAIAYSKLNVGTGEILYEKLDLNAQLRNDDWSSNPDHKLAASKIDPNFGSSTIVTLGGIKLGDDPYVTLSADPTSNYTFTFPAEDGSAGQTLVRDALGDLVWASVPGLSLLHNNIMVGDPSDLPQAVDTTANGDILADDVNGLTIKNDVITNDMINASAAIAYSKLEAEPLALTGGTMTGAITLDEEGLIFNATSPATPVVGQTYWDDQDKTISTKLSSSVTLQHGQELHTYVYNDSGSLIADGTVVYINAANAARATIRKAQANSSTTADKTIGIVTADIADGAYGYVTTFGLVRNMTTNVDSASQAVSDGDTIYLSAALAGGWVKNAPSAPNHHVRIGQVVNAGAGNSGTILVHPDVGSHLEYLHNVAISSVANMDLLQYETASTLWKNKPNPSADNSEPMGLNGAPTVTYQGSRTIRIAHPFSYWYKGLRVSSSANVDVQVPNTTGLYFIVFTDAALTATYTTTPDILNQVIYAGFYWNATTSDYMFLEERHGIAWSANEHKQAHLTRGAAYESGGAISGYVLNDDNNVSIALGATYFWDEDIRISCSQKLVGDNFDKWSRAGTNGDWFKDTSDTIGAFHAANVAKINTYSAPNWVLSNVTNGNYFNTYVFGTNSAESTNRFIVVPGQNQSTTLAGAQSFTIANLNLGTLPVQEILPMYQLTWQYRTTYTGNDARVRLIAVTDLRRTQSPAVAAGVNTNHNSLSGRSDADSHPASAISGLDGSTATESNSVVVPKDTTSNLSSLTKTAGRVVYDTTQNKLLVGDGSGWKVAGGGLITVYKAFSDGDFTAENGKHYIVDMAGANALRTITLPTGAAESVVRVTCINNDSATYPLTVARDSGHYIFYNDTDNTTVSFPYAEQWAEFSYTVTGTHWVVNDGSTPLSGTWSGSLYATGNLYGCISPNAKAGSDAAVTLTASDSRFQYLNLSAARVYKLPSTDIKAGDTFTFVNRATTDGYRLNLQASADTGTTYVDWIVNGKITVMALQDAPTAAAHWATTDAISDWTVYSPTFAAGWGTLAASWGYYRRTQGSVDIMVRFTAGTTSNATDASFTLPSGLTSRSINSGNTAITGILSSTGSPYDGNVMLAANSSTVYLLPNNANKLDTGCPANTWASSSSFSVIASHLVNEWSMFN